MTIPSSFDQDAFQASYEELCGELARSFLATLPEHLSAIEEALIQKNPKALEQAAHSLKGAVAVFFAETAKTLAFKLELMGQREWLQGSEEALDALKGELAQLSADLKALADLNR